VEGLKFSAPNFELFTRCKKELPGNPPCFNGSVPEIAMSAKIGAGAIVGIGSMLPGLCVRIFDAAVKGQDDLAKKYQEAVNASYSIYGGEGWPLWPSAQKHVLMRRGIIRTNFATEPFVRIGEDEAARIDQALEGIEDWVFNPPAC
jgi:dihydrodipicolinate synthase/N-acetylneuraminate lyase